MSQKLVQSQSMQQVQTLSPQQVLQVRLLEMPVSELEQRVKNELIDNGALEESLGSPEDADTSSEDVYDGTDAESAGIETSGLDGGLPSDEYRPAEVRQAMDDYRTPDDVPDYLLQERGGKDRPETMDYGDTTSFYEQMTEQMNECDLTPREQELMTYLIGSLENDGLLKKKLSTLADELEIYANYGGGTGNSVGPFADFRSSRYRSTRFERVSFVTTPSGRTSREPAKTVGV